MLDRFLVFAFIVLFVIGITVGWNVPLTHLVLSLGVVVLIQASENLWDALHP